MADEIFDLDRFDKMIPPGLTTAEKIDYGARNTWEETGIVNETWAEWDTALSRIRYDYNAAAADAWDDASAMAAAQQMTVGATQGAAGDVVSKSTGAQSVTYASGAGTSGYGANNLFAAKMARRYRSKARAYTVPVTELLVRVDLESEIYIPIDGGGGEDFVTMMEMAAAFEDHVEQPDPHPQYVLDEELRQVDFNQAVASTLWTIAWPYAEDPDVVIYNTQGNNITRGVMISKDSTNVYITTDIPVAGRATLRG